MKKILIGLAFAFLTSISFAKNQQLSFSIYNPSDIQRNAIIKQANQPTLNISRHDIIKADIIADSLNVKPPLKKTYVVIIQLSKAAGKRLENFTKNQLGKYMLIKIGNETVSLAVIASPLVNHFRIMGLTIERASKIRNTILSV